MLSEVVRPAPEAAVLTWLDKNRVGFLSALTIGELQKGIESLPEGIKRRQLRAWLEKKVFPEFFERILPIDLEIALGWGNLQAELQATGAKLPVVDGLLAATALAHRLTLVTRNSKDFARTGVQIVNPWS